MGSPYHQAGYKPWIGNDYDFYEFYTNRLSFAAQAALTNEAPQWSPEWGPTNAPIIPTFNVSDGWATFGWYPVSAATAVRWQFDACTNKTLLSP
jgi:hypothetical protein